MSRVVIVDPAAVDEAEAQAAYYSARAGEAIALRFAAEVDGIYQGLAAGRLVGVPHSKLRSKLAIKRVFLTRFPFAIVFYEDANTIKVVALEALRKRPGYWRQRLPR